MTLAAPTTRTPSAIQPVDAARVLGGCRGPGASARLEESGLLRLRLLPADGGITPSTAAEVVRVLAVAHLENGRCVRRSLLASDAGRVHQLVGRLLDVALETGSAAAALHGAVAAVRDAGPADDATIRLLGELSVAVTAAEATLTAAGIAVDAVLTAADDPDLLHDEALVAVTIASVLAARAASDSSRAMVRLDDAPSPLVDTPDLAVLGGWAVTGRVAD